MKATVILSFTNNFCRGAEKMMTKLNYTIDNNLIREDSIQIHHDF